MDFDEQDQWIADTWFPDHVANYQKHGDLAVLTFRKPDTFTYHTRFVFDGCRMHVTGDIGTASFWFTENASVFNQCEYSLGYFVEKIEAIKDGVYFYNSKMAADRLREWVEQLDEDGVAYDKKRMDRLLHMSTTCMTIQEWSQTVHDNLDFIEALDGEFYEWLFEIGNDYSNRVRGYLVALKLAAKQLTEPKRKAIRNPLKQKRGLPMDAGQKVFVSGDVKWGDQIHRVDVDGVINEWKKGAYALVTLDEVGNDHKVCIHVRKSIITKK